MKAFTKWYSGLNAYYQLSPFLILYLIICILFAHNVLIGDEGRYLWFANNILEGYYSPPYPRINLWNGPGYPAFIAPFILLGFPLLALKLLNGFLLYFSLVITFKTISIYSSRRNAFIFTLLTGLYFPMFQNLPLIITESLTWFFISLVCFVLIKTYQNNNLSWKLILLSAFSLACLTMTKVIFGYVILFMILVAIGMFFIPLYRSSAKKTLFIYVLSLALCLPWLFYTYHLTHKIFYWTNSAGMSLYTMSSPVEKELGDWLDTDVLETIPDHKVFIDSVSALNSFQRNEAFEHEAIKNMESHPGKYLSNWIANVGRLLFSYPFSYKPQTIKSFFTIIPNMFIVVLIVFTLAVSLVNYRKLPVVFVLLLLFILIYLFGCTIVSAYRRMFYVTMPFWFMFFSYFFSKMVSIKIRED